MDRTKSRLTGLGGFFEHDDDDNATIPPKTLDTAKMSHYTAGVVKKSKREKEQEAAELKKKEEEVEAARVYAEYMDAFEGDGRKPGTAFVKAGQSGSSRADGPPTRPRAFDRSVSPPTNLAKPKGKRAMDSFLDEIKRDQAVREAKYSRQGTNAPGKSVTAMAAYEGQSGSRDRGDSQTTNVFVANLPSHVTESTLGMFFARMGPVASVKVMWPRTDGTAGPGADMTASRRAKSTGLSGFVSFMKREDAEDALRELDGYDWGGSILRVGWSKAVSVPARPLYVVATQKRKNRSRSRTRGGHSGERSRSRSCGPSRSRSPKRQRRRSSPFSRSPSPDPIEDASLVTNTFIRAVAAEVKGQDDGYEETLKRRERNNPKYAFLQPKNRRHYVYRDLLRDKRSVSPEFEDDGYNSVYSTDSAEESEHERVSKTSLGKYARRRFEAMLRALSGNRGEVARCMAFSLEHAEAAHEVADIIITSLLVDSTPVPRKVARLHLICDILHNSASSVPSAWKYRGEFQSRLGIVFDHLSNIYHSFPGRITAETFKKQITTVVDIWDDWIVFPADFLAELRTRLEGNVQETSSSVERAETTSGTASTETQAVAPKFKTVTSLVPVAAEADLDSTPMEDLDGQPLGEDVDGEPLDDVDGAPIADVDGEPMEGVDGRAIDLDEEPINNVDGEPLEDVDGVAMDEGDSDVDGVPL